VFHPLAEAYANLGLRSQPHEYWRWLDHAITHTDFKKGNVGLVELQTRYNTVNWKLQTEARW